MKKQKKASTKKKNWLKKFTNCKKTCNKNWKKVVVVLGVFGLLVYFKGMFIVGFVNNQPIFKSSYVKELEAQSGQQVFETLATKSMLFQEAKKKGIKVTKEEVDAELAKIEEIAVEQGITFDKLLVSQNVKKSDLIKQIELQKTVEKMAGEGITVTDEEASLYLEQNADFLPEGADPSDLMEIAKEQLKQQQLNSVIQEMILELKEKSKVVSWL